MPKKHSKPFWGSRNSGGSEDKHYFGHDDRSNRSNNASKFLHDGPRVSFKKQSFKETFKSQKDHNMRKHALIKQQIDDDVLMSAGSNNNTRQMVNRGRGKGFIRGRNSPLPHGGMRNGQQRQVPFSESNWYKVFIPRGQKYTKEFVIGNLLSCAAPITFNPIMYKIVGNDAIFYVEDHRAAAKIADCDKRITTSDGFKMNVRVRPGSPPIEISDELKERLKLAMGKRYLADTNALDLSKFYLDPELSTDYWCPLFRSNMLTAVLDIVAEHIPNLSALNLDSNKLIYTDNLRILGNKFENLKILYIGDNKIRDMKYLDPLRNLQLEELRLEGNPLCHRFRNKEDEYSNIIRTKFPKLVKLDGKELPPKVEFDVGDQKGKLPITNKIYIFHSDEKAQMIAQRFLEEYFMVFDSENRQPLLNAYHEHACFSITAPISTNSNKYSQYFSESRNLCRVSDLNRRRKFLKQGKLAVVTFISGMPRTKHDLLSFTMDLSLVTEGMMIITVTGLFKELLRDNKELLRYFNRTFVIVPEGPGYCISNEQLHITNPTSNQEKQFNNPTVVVPPIPGPSSVPAPINNIVPLSEEIKQQMTVTLSQQTGMILEWSFKCLEEVQWNFENALKAFQDAFQLGKVPREAFKQ